MGLISLIFSWPVAPVKGVIKLGELIQEQIERETADPAAIRRRLEEIERDAEAGRISEEEAREATERLLQRLIPQPEPTDTPMEE
ncbi:gas vesicle protein GvpG [Sinosporangium siamense]|uniref:Gas vesicle protein G n=1 Tax=Sinosporangium siamense TaxID=1367973 RepID=A0A919RFW1_9ACTN|nr:gas vesicle protein GvpG [Sinosporangium siamense]GII92873.1 hypothetical protein Ssi02_31040 [Sinosporangium siamense]